MTLCSCRNTSPRVPQKCGDVCDGLCLGYWKRETISRAAAFLRVIGYTPLDTLWQNYEMRKGFTRKPKPDEPATHVKNYITPSGLQRLKDEHRFLLTRPRHHLRHGRAFPGEQKPVKTPTISTAS